jgi:hypothetical protein
MISEGTHHQDALVAWTEVKEVGEPAAPVEESRDPRCHTESNEDCRVEEWVMESELRPLQQAPPPVIW